MNTLLLLQEGGADHNVVPSQHFITVSEWTLMIIFSLVIPLINGLLTKYTLASNIKMAITIVLNAGAALLTNHLQTDGTAVISQQAFVLFVVGVVVSIASYFRVYKPLGITSSTPDGKLLPNVGLPGSGSTHRDRGDVDLGTVLIACLIVLVIILIVRAA